MSTHGSQIRLESYKGGQCLSAVAVVTDKRGKYLQQLENIGKKFPIAVT